MVTVTSLGTGTQALRSGYVVPPPSGASMVVPVANSGNAGSWLVAVCGWQAPAAFGSTVAVGDDAHNRWEPLGAPSGTSSASGTARCSIWAAANPAVAGNVFIAPTGFVQAMSVAVYEVAGLAPWMNVTVTTGFANAGTAVTVASGVPPSSSLMLTACASDNNLDTVTLAAGGWTALSAVVASNGTDHTSDLTLTPAWQVASGLVTAAYSSSGAQDMAAVMAAVVVAPAAPQPPSQTWPYVRFEVGFGSGVGTPWDQVSWTDLTGRFRAASGQRGKQYELDTIQAGTMNFTLSNNDGALTPGNSTSPFYPDVQLYTPARWLATWPPPPAASSRTYVVWRGFIERWPLALSSTRYQNTPAVGIDVWATFTTLLKTIARDEILEDQPYAYWPLADLAGSVQAVNLAASGGAGPLQVVQSKYGAGSGTYSFGNTPSNLLAGDPSTTVWAQSGLTSGNTVEGYSLVCAASSIPSLNPGITVEGWFQVSNSNPANAAGWTLIAVKNTSLPMARVYVDQPTGHIMITVWDKTTRASTTSAVNSSQSWADNTFTHVALLLTQTTWQVILDGGAFTGASGTCNLSASPAFLDFCGEADRLSSGAMFNGQVYGLAVFPRILPASRIVSHEYSATIGFATADPAGRRIERILAAASSLQPRMIGTTVDTVQPALDIQGQAAGQSVVNMAESEGGLLYVDGPGYLCYLPRRAGYNLASSWTAGELAGLPMNSNPYFAGLTGPWTVLNGTIALTTAEVYGGPYSALLTPGAAVTFCAIYAELVPVTVGHSYIAQAWVWSPTGYADVEVGFDWHSAGGGYLSTSTITVAVAARTWTLVSTTQTAPASSVTGQIRVGENTSPATSNLLYVAQGMMLDGFQTEAPYQADVSFDYDPSNLYDDITLTQYAAPQAIGGANVSAVSALSSTALIASYGDQTLQETIYLSSAATIGDLANWVLNTDGTPRIRASQMNFDPAANPALWPIVLAAEVGKVITVNRRLAGTQLEISQVMQIMGVAHSTEPGKWVTRVQAVWYPGNVLTSDDSTRGLLNGTNLLGW